MKLRTVVALAVAMLMIPVIAVADAPNDADRRAEDILKQMTLQEKLDYIGGYQDMRIKPIERLGVPPIIMSDGPMGSRSYGPC